ncbi:hypothetical protein SSU98_1356 [Streptococcus suis 98HAH33]|nr:hypothetical protein SSU98_1356 [Streptococcus suis 98HAH33]
MTENGYNCKIKPSINSWFYFHKKNETFQKGVLMKTFKTATS